MDKIQAVNEVVVYSEGLLTPKLKETAYLNCEHEGKCYKECSEKQECNNKAVLVFWWIRMVGLN